MSDETRGVTSKIVRIGNSQGVRIPKPLLEQAGLDGPVRLGIVDSGILIERRPDVREGWAKAAKRLGEREEAGLLDEPTTTGFDETE